MNTIITLQQLVAGYSSPTTIAVDLSVARGEVVGLSGENGIGKSTIFKAIVGTAKIFSGSIERAETSRISYLAQQPVRLSELPLSGHELLAMFQAKSLKAPARLTELLRQRIDRLSGGEYQLLSLLAVLSLSADLLLLDEPTNNLDTQYIHTAVEEINSLRPNCACLVISHDQDFLAQVCTRIKILGRD